MLPLIIIFFAVLGAPLFTMFGAFAINAYWNPDEVFRSLSIISDIESLTQAPTLLTIPLFTFAGYVLAESGAPTRLVNVAKACIGWIPGGIAIVTIFVCSFFTAFTGASGVTIIAMGGLMYPILMKEGYGDKFSIGLVTACGSLGLLFPPSLPIILYGVVSNTLIDQLFLAGIVPGIVLMAILSIYSIYIAKKMDVKSQPFDAKALWPAIREAIWELPLPVIILCGIYRGWFTASDAAPVTALYVIIAECVVHREVGFGKDLMRILKESMIIVGGILIILGIATAMTRYMILAKIPDQLFEWVKLYIGDSKWMFIIILNLFLLVVGCLMDIFSATIVIVPIMTPIFDSYFGVDMITHKNEILRYYLAIMFLTNLEIGYLTPPVGLNLFISSFRFRRPVLQIYRLAAPFMVIMLLALTIIASFPWLSTYLVESFGQVKNLTQP